MPENRRKVICSFPIRKGAEEQKSPGNETEQER
jgi:hypothetical protein